MVIFYCLLSYTKRGVLLCNRIYEIVVNTARNRHPFLSAEGVKLAGIFEKTFNS